MSRHFSDHVQEAEGVPEPQGADLSDLLINDEKVGLPSPPTVLTSDLEHLTDTISEEHLEAQMLTPYYPKVREVLGELLLPAHGGPSALQRAGTPSDLWETDRHTVTGVGEGSDPHWDRTQGTQASLLVRANQVLKRDGREQSRKPARLARPGPGAHRPVLCPPGRSSLPV